MKARGISRIPAVCFALLTFLFASTLQARADFKAFVSELWPDAQAAGISRATFDDAFRGMTPDPSVIAQTKKQSEFVRPIWDYVNGAVTGSRAGMGSIMIRLAAARRRSSVRCFAWMLSQSRPSG